MKALNKLIKSTCVNQDTFKLTDYPAHLKDVYKQTLQEYSKVADDDLEHISKWQNKLYAEDRQSLLIILQGMDSSGKDGTIKYLMKGWNPQGVMVSSFKHPSLQELEHDYLWRHTLKLPEHGQIAIFNRSHYENVLISKVHPSLVLSERLKEYNTLSKIDKSFWNFRYHQIKQFEKSQIEAGTQILKIFLHISKDEQAKRFIDRINSADKHWKFSSVDIEERGFWNEYQFAYEMAIRKTSTHLAPWNVIPADDKAYTHLMIQRIVLDKLVEMNPILPPKTSKERSYMQQAKLRLQNEMRG